MSEDWELEQEPDDLIGRLRYWGHSKSRVRRGYHTGRMQDVMNEAAQALEAARDYLGNPTLGNRDALEDVLEEVEDEQ